MRRKIIAFVPMRHASERVPEKNYRDFNGKPLFFWIVETLMKCRCIDSIYIDTDSPVIKEKAGIFKNKVHVIDRPKEFCGDMVPMNDILLYDVSLVDANLYLQTHSTNPLLKPDTIERAIEAFLSSKEHDSLFSVTRLQTRLWKEGAKAVNHDPGKLERTQDLPPIYEENSNIYLFSKNSILETKNRIGKNPMMFEISKNEALDIDDNVDFKIAQALHKIWSN